MEGVAELRGPGGHGHRQRIHGDGDASDGTNDNVMQADRDRHQRGRAGTVTLWAGTDALTMPPQVGDTITGAVMDPDDTEMDSDDAT